MRDRRIKQRSNDSFDRRVNNRIATELDITTYVDDAKFETRMRNMSGNGMQIIEPSKSKFQHNQDCKILIKNDYNTIEIYARIVWNKNGLMGLCFTKSEQQIQKQMNKLSHKLLMSSIAAHGMSAVA